MKIGISNDHSAVELKMAIMDYLSKKVYQKLQWHISVLK